MADLPSSIGYMTVTGDVVAAIADSTDAGTVPDILPDAGTVTLTLRGLPADRPFLVAVVEDKIIRPKAVKCRLSGGLLYPPDDGKDSGATSTDPHVRILAPVQAALDFQNAYWEALVQPAGVLEPSFKINLVGGKPGDVVSLAYAAFVQKLPTTAGQQPVVWVQSGVVIQAGAIPGQYLLDLDTDDLYLIGA